MIREATFRDSMALKIEGGRLLILDQTRIPEEVWMDAEAPEDMIQHIKHLRVRGAPLIGVAAALSLASFATKTRSLPEIREAALALRQARPTAVNLMNALDRQLSVLDTQGVDALVHEAFVIFDEDVQLCESMGKNGAALVNDGESLLTHCNTGGLATVGSGTALAVIAAAHHQGKKIHVFVDETRPLLQGGRLTTWELRKLGIPHTLITDSMAPIVMRDGRVQRVFLGSDRIARNGDFANKVGTYGVAVHAHFHHVAFYPVAPWTTVDLNAKTGADIPIEERDADEVRGARGFFGDIRWVPPATQVFNPAFDVTPNFLVTALVLDCGVLTRDELQNDRLATVLARRSFIP